jgi:hypothetical protein
MNALAHITDGASNRTLSKLTGIIVDVAYQSEALFSGPDGTCAQAAALIGGRIVQVMAPDAEGMPLKCAFVRRSSYSVDL